MINNTSNSKDVVTAAPIPKSLAFIQDGSGRAPAGASAELNNVGRGEGLSLRAVLLEMNPHLTPEDVSPNPNLGGCVVTSHHVHNDGTSPRSNERQETSLESSQQPAPPKTPMKEQTVTEAPKPEVKNTKPKPTTRIPATAYKNLRSFADKTGVPLFNKDGWPMKGFQFSTARNAVAESVLMPKGAGIPSVAKMAAFFRQLADEAEMTRVHMAGVKADAASDTEIRWIELESMFRPFAYHMENVAACKKLGKKPGCLSVSESVGISGNAFDRAVRKGTKGLRLQTKAIELFAHWVNQRPQYFDGDISNVRFSDFVLTNHGLDGYLFTVRIYNAAEIDEQLRNVELGDDSLPTRKIYTMVFPISFAGLE